MVEIVNTAKCPKCGSVLKYEKDDILIKEVVIPAKTYKNGYEEFMLLDAEEAYIVCPQCKSDVTCNWL